MTRTKTYEGSFLSVGGHIYSVELWQNNETLPPDFTDVGELTFSADSPAEIEYSDKGKFDTWQSSTLQLNVISPSDRLYTDLYSVDPRNILCKVYKDSTLFWQGFIDTEVYSEPYESEKNYTVTLTFSDFAPLDRIKFSDLFDTREEAIGYNNLAAILNKASDYLEYTETLRRQISGQFIGYYIGSDPVYLSVLSYAEANTERLYSKSAYEAIEELLRPLSISLRQEGGRLCAYDINYLYSWAKFGVLTPTQISWASDSQNFSFDSTTNTVTVTYDTGNESAAGWDESIFPLDTDKYPEVLDYHYYTYEGFDFNRDGIDYKLFSIPMSEPYLYGGHIPVGYRFSSNTQAYNFILSSASLSPDPDEDSFHAFNVNGYQTFRLIKGEEGEDAEGVACYFRKGYTDYSLDLLYPNLGTSNPYLGDHTIAGRYGSFIGYDPFIPSAGRTEAEMQSDFVACMKTPSMSLPASLSVSDNYLRLKMQAAYDMRINMYSDGHEYVFTQTGTTPTTADSVFSKLSYRNAINQLLVPVRVIIETPTQTLYYTNIRNTGLTDEPGLIADSVVNNSVHGEWTTTPSNCWLSYRRDYSDHYYEYGYPFVDTGFAMNKESYNTSIIDFVHEEDLDFEGELIKLPSIDLAQSTVRIEVSARYWIAQEQGRPTRQLAFRLNENASYALVTVPSLEVVGVNDLTQSIKEFQQYDAVTTGIVNESAKDDTDVDIMFSSYDSRFPNARGSYVLRYTNASDVEIKRNLVEYTHTADLVTLERITDPVDAQIINNYFSQYNDRHDILEGTAMLTDPSVKVFTDAAEANKLFMPTSSVLNLADDTQDTKFVEITKLEYIPRE